ncbi:ATP-binding cassette domain-containing protein [Paenibacillus sp. MBLB4367]|uniref:ATP-binding cassette domain-containing protein n=1 Tax=Paenibacillus sp. MBLB4367 TaxID=3384767 RepID=UPI0039082296
MGNNTELSNQFHGGHEISGGQWQKIALSRAFIREAQVIVLDEPTAALDPISEAAIFEHFMQLTEGKTSIFITHRLGSCRKADRIFVMNSGMIVEQGNHDQLISQQGLYARMFEMQAKWYVS